MCEHQNGQYPRSEARLERLIGLELVHAYDFAGSLCQFFDSIIVNWQPGTSRCFEFRVTADLSRDFGERDCGNEPVVVFEISSWQFEVSKFDGASKAGPILRCDARLAFIRNDDQLSWAVSEVRAP